MHQGGIFDAYHRLAIGTFETTGDELAIRAEATCRPAPTGSMSVEPATLPPVTLPPVTLPPVTLPPTDLALASDGGPRSLSLVLPVAFVCALAALLALLPRRRGAGVEA